MNSYGAILNDIKIAHTIFALPFAIMSAFIAAGGWPGASLLGFIALAMVFARSAAMAFNRLIDAPLDKENPRTKERALPAGKASHAQYIAFITASGVGFIVTCGYINMLALKLAPVALFIVFFYSYTKRFTPYTHFFLGAALSLAPVGAWVAVNEELSYVAITLGGAVIFWLAGLDIIYSCQDYEFDGQNDLKSLPQHLGIERALKLAALFHLIMICLLIVVGIEARLSWIYAVGVAFTALLLWYEHSLVSSDDLTKVNVAFFNVNGLISIGLMFFVMVDTMALPASG